MAMTNRLTRGTGALAAVGLLALTACGGGDGGNSLRDVSPLPAPVPTKPAPIPRESLDGETIFALGDEDRISDDDDGDESDGERKRLTGSGSKKA